MRRLFIVLTGVGLAFGTIADPVSANIRKKKGAPNRCYVRPTSSAQTSWFIWIDGFETLPQSVTTYQAVGIKFRSPPTQLMSGAPANIAFNTQNGSAWPNVLAHTAALPDANVTTAMSQQTRLGTGARGFRATSSGTQIGNRPVAMRIFLPFTQKMTYAQICSMMSRCDIAIDECTNVGFLRATQYEMFTGHPCGDFKTGSTTLPAGFEQIEGAAQFHASFTPYQNTTPAYRYIPGRAVFSYRSSTFGWNPTSPKTINEIRMRQDGTPRTFTPHKTLGAFYMSVDGMDPATPRFTWFVDACHGKNKANVFPKAWTNYPASVKLPPTPSNFDVVVKFAKPYIVAANSKNLIIEHRGYTTDITQTSSTTWEPDAAHLLSDLNRGTLTRSGTACPTAMKISNYMGWSDGDFTNYIDTGVPNAPVVAWIGTKLPTPVPVAPGCSLYVNGFAFLTGLSEATTRGRAYFHWGRMPTLAPGTRIGYQFAVVKIGYPWLGMIGLSEGAEYVFGLGWTHPRMEFGAVFAYDNASIERFTNPDSVPVAHSHVPAAVIFDIR